jgi:pimeloyl-ACP methyl ester carboxylesterase
LQRIAGYVGKAQRFASSFELEQHLRQIAAPFGPLSDAQWRHLARYSAKQLPDGAVVYRYDPGIAAAFKGPLQAVDLWTSWQQIQCPTLVLRGAESDLLLRSDAQAMTQRGPCAHLVEFPGVGHAPALLDAAQIAVVREWLLD